MRLTMALGAIFVSALAISACGGAVPGDDVAVVAGNGISARALAHWSYVASVGQSQVQPGAPVIVPDPPNYTKCIASLKKIAPASIPKAELKSACASQFQQTMEYLIRTAWLQGQAASEGVKVTAAQVRAKFTAAKAKQFTSASQYTTFLAQTGQTENDILYRFRISLLSQKLATPAAVQAYYKSHLSIYSTPAARSIRIVLNKSQAKIRAAKAALGHGASWQSVTKRYSTDPATKASGGLLAHVFNGEEPVALNTVIFSAQKGVLLGPIKTPFGYYLAEVTQIFPAVVQPLAKEKASIQATIANTALSTPPWMKKWKAKTVCRGGFQIPDCKNYVAPKPPKVRTTPTTAGAPTTTSTPTVTQTTTAPATTTTTKK